MPSLPNPTPSTQARAQAQLESMGIPGEFLQAAADEAWRAASRCTDNDVQSMRGFLIWGVTIRFLRDRLCPLGWTIGRDKNFETVVSPDGRVAITAAAGDSHTGDPARMPATRTERGPQTKLVIAANNQLTLEDELRHVRGDDAPAEAETWFLLSYHDPIGEEIRIELSRGITFTASGGGKHGIVSHFEPRILLDPLDVSDGAIEESEQDRAADEQIDVPVSRRAG